MPAATDNQKTNLVHAWVMVLAGKREVRNPHGRCCATGVPVSSLDGCAACIGSCTVTCNFNHTPVETVSSNVATHGMKECQALVTLADWTAWDPSSDMHTRLRSHNFSPSGSVQQRLAVTDSMLAFVLFF